MVSAAQGLRRTDRGSEPIANPEQLCAIRKQARRMWLYSQGTAVTATAAIALLPG